MKKLLNILNAEFPELLSDDPLVRLYAKEKLNRLKLWGIK